jgi:hypothetical protein
MSAVGQMRGEIAFPDAVAFLLMEVLFRAGHYRQTQVHFFQRL